MSTIKFRFKPLYLMLKAKDGTDYYFYFIIHRSHDDAMLKASNVKYDWANCDTFVMKIIVSHW